MFRKISLNYVLWVVNYIASCILNYKFRYTIFLKDIYFVKNKFELISFVAQFRVGYVFEILNISCGF